MAKPVIYFKGVKYKAGTLIGYRPQLEVANKVTDFDLADEICIEKRLSMSPEELLHAVKTTLLTVPQLVQKDGRVREFTNLLSWNRTASGKLEAATSPWNETCKANIKVQLKKDTKGVIDGQFINEVAMPTPRLDNVTFVGATSVQNVIKVGTAFAAYGRQMQFNAALGDTAYLWHEGTQYALTCTTSDAAHAVFAWPSNFPSIEQGTMIQFVMKSRAGIEGAAATTTQKSVVLIAATLPRVSVTSFTASKTGNTVLFQVEGEHLDGADGFTGGGIDPASFPLQYKIGSGSWTNLTITSPTGETGTFMGEAIATCNVGDAVDIKFNVDPTSIEYQVETVTANTTIVAG